MIYYLSIQEREQMEYDMHKAVTTAIEYVKQHRNGRAKSA